MLSSTFENVRDGGSTITQMISLLEVEHYFASKEGLLQAVSSFTLDISDGEFVALVGPSGCGKTTILNILAGLERQTGGEVTIAGRRPRPGDPDVGYVLARDSLLPWRTAHGNAVLALEVMGRYDRNERNQRATDALVAVGLSEFQHSYPAQLSQGMRQRVALARAFAAEPKVLLMDEPFSALDAQTRFAVHDQFLGAWEQQLSTVVLVTHDLAEAITLADRVVIMTRRPTRIKAVHEIHLPRPRSVVDLQSDGRFHKIYEAVWRDLETEVRPSQLPKGAVS